jgi:hypothetical protein
MSMHYSRTRRNLHALAELVVAGPRYRRTGSLGLRVRPEGFGTRDDPLVAIAGTDLVTDAGRLALDGLTFAEAATKAGLVASRLDDVYGDGPQVAPTETISLHPQAARDVEDALAIGDEALRMLDLRSDPILWPEHFDVAVEAGGATYGLSPGDGFLPEPYAYVAAGRQVAGSFWSAPFGAARPLTELGDAEATAAFFEEGRRRLGSPSSGVANGDRSQ